MNNINIFILAGGFGKRLKSVISDIPKPMAPIDNKPFLYYQIKQIRDYFPENKIYILTHYLSEVIESYFKDDSSIIILKESKPLDTGGSIKNAINILQLQRDSSILVFNGDTYIKPNLKDMINKSQGKISILASLEENCDRYGTLSIKENEIIDFNEKQLELKNSYINAGCYYFNNLDFFANIEEEKFAIEDKFKKYLSHDTIAAYKYKDIFIDIGIPEDYERMKNYIKEVTNENH